jgi:hypothetical protein
MLNGRKFVTMTRVGFAARGVMYLLIGFLSLRLGRSEDGAGAMEYLDSGAGRVLLAIMAAGFFAYAAWRLFEAWLDSEGHGSDGKGSAARLGGAASGLVHLALGFTAARLASGGGGSGGGGAEGGAATALSFPGGQTLLVVASILLLIAGLYQLAKAAKADFLRHLDPEAARQPWVKLAGRAGYAARGVVFVVMAWFLWQAGRQESASEAGDMGQALASLPATLQMIVAAGLFLFGVFSLVEARFRRINDPQVMERLNGKAAARSRGSGPGAK